MAVYESKNYSLLPTKAKHNQLRLTTLIAKMIDALSACGGLNWNVEILRNIEASYGAAHARDMSD